VTLDKGKDSYQQVARDCLVFLSREAFKLRVAPRLRWHGMARRHLAWDQVALGLGTLGGSGLRKTKQLCRATGSDTDFRAPPLAAGDRSGCFCIEQRGAPTGRWSLPTGGPPLGEGLTHPLL